MPQNPTKRLARPPAAEGRCVVRLSADRTWRHELDAQHQKLSSVFVAMIDRTKRVSKSDDQRESHSELLRLIAEAEQLLPDHFTFEEAGGYLGEAMAVAPHLSKRAALLQSDHGEFAARFAKLATFARELREMDEGWDYLGVAIRAFTGDLRLHELKENQLVQEAFLDDPGGGLNESTSEGVRF